MTTNVKIEHMGPAFKDVLVETQSKANRANQTKRLKVGESVVVSVYDTQQILVTEIAKEDRNVS